MTRSKRPNYPEALPRTRQGWKGKFCLACAEPVSRPHLKDCPRTRTNRCTHRGQSRFGGGK